MNHVKSTPCITPGCKFLAADDIRCSGMCGECFRKDCEDGQEIAIVMNQNMQRFGCIDEPAIVTDACHLVNIALSGMPLSLCDDLPAVSLARATIMLTGYGSKPESILRVIHEHGHTVVTLADVEAVRNFVLEKL